MPIASPRYRFTLDGVTSAPAEPGVYALYRLNELLYVSFVEAPAALRERLLQHLHCQRLPTRATHFAWEISHSPKKRHAELMREHASRHASPPAASVVQLRVHDLLAACPACGCSYFVSPADPAGDYTCKKCRVPTSGKALIRQIRDKAITRSARAIALLTQPGEARDPG
jgi:hypothetical protein